MTTDRAQRKVPTVPDSTPEKSAANQTEREQEPQKPENEDSTTQADETVLPGSADEEIRQAKINAIREQLATGTYSISGKDVATKILNILKG